MPQKRRVTLDVAELPRFPAVFCGIECGVEHEAVGVEVGVGDSIDGSCGEVYEFAPDHICRGLIAIAASSSYAGFHFRFHVPHRFIYRAVECVHEPLVFSMGVEHRKALGGMEIEVIADATLILSPKGQGLSGHRMPVIAQSIPRLFADFARQTQPGGTFPSPSAFQFLAFRVIVCRARRRVIALGSPGG